MILKHYFVYTVLGLSVAIAGCSNGEGKEGKMSENVIELTDANFETETGKGVVLIDFWAPRCPPCRTQGPIIDRVAAAVTGKAKVGKYNVDAHSKVADKFGFRSIPTLIILRDREEVARFSGLTKEEDLTTTIENYTK